MAYSEQVSGSSLTAVEAEESHVRRLAAGALDCSSTTETLATPTPCRIMMLFTSCREQHTATVRVSRSGASEWHANSDAAASKHGTINVTGSTH